MNTNVATEEAPAASPLKLYPNPVMDEIRFDLPEFETASSAEIFDALGVCVQTQLTLDDKYIRLRELPSGLYFLRITAESGAVFSNLFQKVKQN